MRSLRLQLIGLFVVVALVVAGTIFLAVSRYSSEQFMSMAMEGGWSAEEAQAMFDDYFGRVLLVGAGTGIALGALATWWSVRRILRPLDRLTDATRAIAAGDLGHRVPQPPDRELVPVADAFNQMASTLERVEQLRRTLVEDVAHELRTPLTSLQGYLEAMADGVVEPTPEVLRSAHEEIVRLTRLVTELDMLARGADGDRQQARAEVDLAAVVQRVVSIAAPELASREISVHLENAATLPIMLAEPDAIGQVVTNLMHNAARYTDDGGRVIVRLRAEGEWVRCAIENSGSSIPADELPYIWERLYRVDRSRARASGGAGIGLAIVKQIVEAHGGQVGASSGGGRTEIWFRRPATARSA
jgi:two-component system, OmpR family, sensor histidine kinase BaeS